MNIDDLKDQAKEQFSSLKQKAQESDAYSSAQEKYELLSPTGQKILSIAAICLLAFCVLVFPITSFFEANSKIDEFNENKTLIRNLLKVNRKLKQSTGGPSPISIGTLKSRVNASLGNINLLPEQILSTEEVDPKISNLLPKEIKSEALRVSLGKLNIKQISSVGLILQNIDRSIKVTSMDIVSSEDDDHYFDVSYELATFNIPFVEEPEDKKSNRKKR